MFWPEPMLIVKHIIEQENWGNINFDSMQWLLANPNFDFCVTVLFSAYYLKLSRQIGLFLQLAGAIADRASVILTDRLGS